MTLTPGPSFSPLGKPIGDEETKADELRNAKQQSWVRLSCVFMGFKDGMEESVRFQCPLRWVQ